MVIYMISEKIDSCKTENERAIDVDNDSGFSVSNGNFTFNSKINDTKLYIKQDAHQLYVRYEPGKITTHVAVKNQNVGEKKDLTLMSRNNVCIPREVIVNGTASVIKFGDTDKIVLNCAEDDNFDIVYAFLYAYFLHTNGVSKTRASKFFNELRNIGNAYCGGHMTDKVVRVKSANDDLVEKLNNALEELEHASKNVKITKK